MICSKKAGRVSKRSTKPVDGKTPVSGLPASQRVTAPPCPTCRDVNTFVYATKPPKRYCKCKRCGWTWKIVIGNPTP